MKTNKLFLSAALVILLSLSAAAYAHEEDGYDYHEEWAKHGHHGMECGVGQLPQAKLKILHEAMKASLEKDKALYEEKYKLHEQLREVVSAEIFNEKAYLALNARLEAVQDQMHKDRLKAFASVAGQFSPEDREKIIRMQREHHRRMHHEAGWHGHHAWNQGDHGWGHEHGWHDGQEWRAQHESSMEQSQPDAQIGGQDYPPYSSR